MFNSLHPDHILLRRSSSVGRVSDSYPEDVSSILTSGSRVSAYKRSGVTVALIPPAKAGFHPSVVITKRRV